MCAIRLFYEALCNIILKSYSYYIWHLHIRLKKTKKRKEANKTEGVSSFHPRPLGHRQEQCDSHSRPTTLIGSRSCGNGAPPEAGWGRTVRARARRRARRRAGGAGGGGGGLGVGLISAGKGDLSRKSWPTVGSPPTLRQTHRGEELVQGSTKTQKKTFVLQKGSGRRAQTVDGGRLTHTFRTQQRQQWEQRWQRQWQRLIIAALLSAQI